MENSYTPFTPTAATTTNTTLVRQQPNVGCWSHQNSASIYEPAIKLENLTSFSTVPLTTAPNSQFMNQPPYQSLPFRHPMEQAAAQSSSYPAYPFLLGQNGIEFGVSSSVPATSSGVQGSCFMQPAEGPSMEQERRALDPYKTKVARIKRKLARQRSLSLQRNASSGAAASTQVDTRRLITNYGADRSDANNNNDQRDLCEFYTPDNKRLRVLLKKELKNSDVGSFGRIVLPKVRFTFYSHGFFFFLTHPHF